MMNRKIRINIGIEIGILMKINVKKNKDNDFKSTITNARKHVHPNEIEEYKYDK